MIPESLDLVKNEAELLNWWAINKDLVTDEYSAEINKTIKKVNYLQNSEKSEVVNTTTHAFGAFYSLILSAKLITTTSHFGADLFFMIISFILFVASALHHGSGLGSSNVTVYSVLRSLDHSCVILQIVSCYVALLSRLDSKLARFVTIAELTTLAAYIPVKLYYTITFPDLWQNTVALFLGWLGILVMPEVYRKLGATVCWLVLGQGLLYTIGAICYITDKPTLNKVYFNGHEAFHLFIIAAWTCFWAALMISV